MSLLRRCLLPLLLTAGGVGCRGLSGTWEGELICVGESLSVDGLAGVHFIADRGGEFDGELRAEGEHASTTGRREMVLSWSLELEKTAPSGRQELDARIDDCELYVDGQLLDRTCPSDAMQWTWDGGSVLEMKGDSCSLALERCPDGPLC